MRKSRHVGARFSASQRALRAPAPSTPFHDVPIQRHRNTSLRYQDQAFGKGGEREVRRPTTTYRGTGNRPYDDRIEARSIFSRKFIKVRNVLSIRAFRSSVSGNPLVATRANVSPFSVINRMISRCRSCGVFPSAVSRRIAEQPASSDNVKCKTQTPCSARAEGASFLHPAVWQRVPMRARWALLLGNNS
jgi:hypothetical protein